MPKITCDDIQRIGDEDTLMHFLEEKLNLPITPGATLAQIALPLPLLFLELDGPIADQIRDCLDLSGNPKNTSEKRRPFLIRFKSKQNYSDILRDVAKNLNLKYADPADLFFICVAENFQPFAFAYFDHPPARDWYTASLTILAWTQQNTYIHTSSTHELSENFLPPQPPIEPNDISKDDSEGKEKGDFSEKNIIPNKPEDNTEEAPSKNQDNASQNYTVDQTPPKNLIAKLENKGKPLEHFNTYAGITIRGKEAFLINEPTRQQLVHNDAKSSVIIKSHFQPNQKWQTTLTPIICIPNSEDRSWHWSSNSPVEAEAIFAKNYPAVSSHLKNYRDLLRTPQYKGKFYWELPPYKHYSELSKAKIVLPYAGNSMRACYDQSGAVVLAPAFFIPTEDLSLLAVLNSKLFDWYIKTKHQAIGKGSIGFKQSNITSFPVAAPTIAQKSDISELVQQILNDPDNLQVFDTEWEIDQLVYELYDLTPAEIALIEKESNP